MPDEPIRTRAGLVDLLKSDNPYDIEKVLLELSEEEFLLVVQLWELFVAETTSLLEEVAETRTLLEK